MSQKSLYRHCFTTYLQILKSCYFTFGFGLLFIYYLFKVPFRLIFVQITMALDHIFYSGFRKVSVEQPLFIIAHPRSASSFFHSLLGEKSKFVTFANWEVRNPSILMKHFMKKFPRLCMMLSLGLLDFRTTPWRLRQEMKSSEKPVRSKVKNIEKNSHQLAPEEEILFTNILDTQYVAVETPLGFNEPEIGFPELTFHDQHEHEPAAMRFFKGCLQRQIFFQGRKQVVAKMNFSLFRIKHLLKTFPDAKFVFLIRSPLDTMPSHLSAQREGLDITYGIDNIPKKALDNFYKTRYRYNIIFYQDLIELFTKHEIPEDRLLLIRYEDIQKNLMQSVEKVQKFGSLDFNPELESKIKQLAEKQSNYQAAHTNKPLEFFGYTEEMIKEDFSSYFEYFTD